MTSETELREIARSTNCLLSDIGGELRVLRNEMRGEIKALKLDAQSDIRTLWLGVTILSVGVALLLVSSFGWPA